jgi:hypothetical protein
MSRPRFLADQDFNEHILLGVERREPLIECVRVHDLGLDTQSDLEILAYAATNGFIVLSHDVNTMTAAAYARMAAGEPMGGLLLAHQRDPVGPIIEDLVLITVASEAEEWTSQVRYLPVTEK